MTTTKFKTTCMPPIIFLLDGADLDPSSTRLLMYQLEGRKCSLPLSQTLFKPRTARQSRDTASILGADPHPHVPIVPIATKIWSRLLMNAVGGNTDTCCHQAHYTRKKTRFRALKFTQLQSAGVSFKPIQYPRLPGFRPGAKSVPGASDGTLVPNNESYGVRRTKAYTLETESRL